jgi:two-component system CheB/CheR fusion protein
LQHRIDELSKANDDMKNVLDSTETATIFLDRDLGISRFTPKVTELIPLVVTDRGRAISLFPSKLKVVDRPPLLTRFSKT